MPAEARAGVFGELSNPPLLLNPVLMLPGLAKVDAFFSDPDAFDGDGAADGIMVEFRWKVDCGMSSMVLSRGPVDMAERRKGLAGLGGVRGG